MRFAARYDDVCDRLCEAVRTLGTHTPEERNRPTVEPVGPGSPVEVASTEDVSDREPLVLVLQAPGAGSGEGAASDPHRERFLRDLEEVRAAAPEMAIVVALPTADRDLLVASGRLGVREVIVCDEEGTPAALAFRLKRAMGEPFVLDFLGALPRRLPEGARLLLARRLEELQMGLVHSPRELARASGRQLGSLGSELRALELAPFETWCERAQVYAAFRQSEEAGVALRHAAAWAGFPSMATFREVCLRETGHDVGRSLQGGAGWSGMLRAMAKRWDPPEPPRESDGGRDPPPVVQPGVGSLLRLRRTTEEAARRIARVRLKEDDAREVVEEVYEAIYLRGAEAWAGLSKSYVLTSVRRRVSNRLRDRRRRPSMVPVGEVSVASDDRGPDAALQAQEVERAVRVTLKTLPPRRALAWWLVDWRGWRPAEAAALLGCSGPALWNLRTRARNALADRLRGLREELA